MALLGNGPSILSLLDQTEFLQPLAKRQGDQSAFRDAAKGYLFLVGKFGLLETLRCDFHRVTFWQLFAARLGTHEADAWHFRSVGQRTATMPKAELPGLCQVPFAQPLLDQAEVCENAIHRRQDDSVICDIAKRLHLMTGRNAR